jgi:hypothetical protein
VTLEDLHEQIWAALQSIAGSAFTPYDGYVPATPETNYAVLWMTPGEARSDRVGWKATDRADQFQITVASANSNRACLATADLVRAKFTGLRLGQPDDPNAPRCKEQPGPGPFPPDTQIPGDIRWWMPMPYRLATSI